MPRWHAKAGKEAKLSYNGNLPVENRHGLIVNTEVFEANGTAERDAALVMLEQIPGTRQVYFAKRMGPRIRRCSKSRPTALPGR
jgi:hypothetical protein